MPHTTEWPVHLYLAEDGVKTVAKVVLTTADNTLRAEGVALKNPRDPSVPEIGDELAAGRALAELARQLMAAAATDVAALADDEPARALSEPLAEEVTARGSRWGSPRHRLPHLDDPVRRGEIIEVHGDDGAPPYLVRWAQPTPDSRRSGP